MGKSSIDYKFNEPSHIADLLDYVDNTYTTHYGGGIQPTEVIMSSGHGTGFILGDIIKYAMRYGKKGQSPEDYRKDLLKIAHYAILALENHDRTFNATK
jgi:hypothetical protein